MVDSICTSYTPVGATEEEMMIMMMSQFGSSKMQAGKEFCSWSKMMTKKLRESQSSLKLRGVENSPLSENH